MVEFTCITIPSFKIKCVPAAAETVLISMGKVQLYKTCVFPKLSENIVNEHNFLFLVRNMNTFDLCFLGEIDRHSFKDEQKIVERVTANSLH